jgi:hypothetical protein
MRQLWPDNQFSFAMPNSKTVYQRWLGQTPRRRRGGGSLSTVPYQW